MWLYILILEDEGSPVVTREREYRIPNRSWPDRIPDFRLPDFAGNVVNGNSLIGSDFSEDPEERRRVRAFNWTEGRTALAVATKAGGFHVIAGNLPYLRLQNGKIPAASTDGVYPGPLRIDG